MFPKEKNMQKVRQKLSVVERVRELQRLFVEKGIEVQAFIRNGRKIPNPLDENHLWILEPDYVFSVRTYKLEAELIRRATDAKGAVTLAGGFYVWRVPATEEVLGLLKQIEEINDRNT